MKLAAFLALSVAFLRAPQDQELGIRIEVDELILDNGLKVLTVERPNAPRVFGALYWKVGSVNERPGITGLSHFFEHMMFKGTDVIGTTDPKRDRELNAQIEEVMGKIRDLKLAGLEAIRRGLPLSEKARKAGVTIRAEDEATWQALQKDYERYIEEQKKISIGEHLSRIFQDQGGTGLNASTYYDWTRYYVELPVNKVELFFWLESDRFLNPVFREFYPEREVVKEERRMRYESTPTGPVFEAFSAQFWMSHPYKWPVIGWMSDIDQYTYADAQQYYETHYVPENCTAIFVGGCKKEEIRELARRYFGRLPKAKSKRDPIVTLEPKQVAEKRMEAVINARPMILIQWHAPSQAHADAPALDLLFTILSGRAGRLHKTLVDEKKLALSAGASYGGRKYGGILSVFVNPKTEASFEEVEKELVAVVERIRTEPVTEAELVKARNQMTANLIRDLDTNSGISSQLGFADVLHDWRDVFRMIPDLNKVTPEDLVRVAKEYLTPQGRNVLVIRRPEAGASNEGGR
ncbi:MAG: insulinase family protein [Planctomycetes bacterium]|nr:insulinase family protein [Planctomycetota bacterium]